MSEQTPDTLRAEIERLRRVCNDWGSNYQSWVDATTAAEAERDKARADLAALRAGISDTLTDWEAGSLHPPQHAVYARLQALLGDQS